MGVVGLFVEEEGLFGLLVVEGVGQFFVVAVVNNGHWGPFVLEPGGESDAMLIVTNSLIFWVKFSNYFLQVRHFLDLACNIGFIGLEELLLRSIILKDESDLFVLFFEGDDFLYHFFVDDCDGHWVFSVPEVVFEVEGIGVVLHKNIVLGGDVFDFVFFRVLYHKHDQVPVQPLLDLLNLIVPKKFDIFSPDIRVDIKFRDLVLFNHVLVSDWWLGLLPVKIQQVQSLFSGFSLYQV